MFQPDIFFCSPFWRPDVVVVVVVEELWVTERPQLCVTFKPETVAFPLV